MYDRPTAGELIDAVRIHLEQAVLPLAKATNHKLYFQTLVAVNVLRIVERELNMADDHSRAEWARLNALDGTDAVAPAEARALAAALAERNAALCAAIRRGDHDGDARVFQHAMTNAIEALQVANPKFLASLAEEDAHPHAPQSG